MKSESLLKLAAAGSITVGIFNGLAAVGYDHQIDLSKQQANEQTEDYLSVPFEEDAELYETSRNNSMTAGVLWLGGAALMLSLSQKQKRQKQINSDFDSEIQKTEERINEVSCKMKNIENTIKEFIKRPT